MIGRMVMGGIGAAAGLMAVAGCQSGPAAGPAAGVDADAAFARIKSLQGNWTSKGGHGEADGEAGTSFEVTSGGSAVVEKLMAGTDQEMVNVYSVDRGSVVMTHYCMMQNQPHLRLTSAAGDRYEFEFVNGGNMASRNEMHMDSMVMTFEGPDHMKTQWTAWKDGKPQEKAEFDIHRVSGGAGGGHASR